MKVAVKNKSEWAYIDAEKIKVGDYTIGELLKRMQKMEQAFQQLFNEMQGKFIVDADKPYILEVNGKLEKVNKLIAHQDKDLNLPLAYYKVENGKIVVDPQKVGAV